MRRELPGGYELDDDSARLDLEAIWDFLSNEAYWGTDRSRDVVERQVREASRTVGLFHEGRQVGFARVVSDGRIVEQGSHDELLASMPGLLSVCSGLRRRPKETRRSRRQ